MRYKVKKGLDIPLAGVPDITNIVDVTVSKVAVLGTDFHGLRPSMNVEVGATVAIGDTLFTDKRNDGCSVTAPASGTVVAINRGMKRALLSVEIEVGGAEDAIVEPIADLAQATSEVIEDRLQRSGLWTALRTRPFSKVPSPTEWRSKAPNSVFVTVTDTNPVAADPVALLAASGRYEQFESGLAALQILTGATVNVCCSPGWSMPKPMQAGIEFHVFEGPHPAGLAGTHIHMIDAVSANKNVWTIGWQDVVAIGELVATGKLLTERYVALGGPEVTEPCIVRTRLGASVEQICDGRTSDGENRIVSGPVLSGNKAAGPLAYLGRYHNQIVVLHEGREQHFLGWLTPGFARHSALSIYASQMNPDKKLKLTTSTNGSARMIMPTGSFEKVMPLDILPTPLLKAIAVGDTDSAQDLGCLELDEEDVGLLTYVCVGKLDYGDILRSNLTTIEAEG